MTADGPEKITVPKVVPSPKETELKVPKTDKNQCKPGKGKKNKNKNKADDTTESAPAPKTEDSAPKTETPAEAPAAE